MEKQAKRRKRLNFPGLRREIIQFVLETLENPPLRFSDDQFAPFIPKISNKIKKSCTFKFKNQFYKTCAESFLLTKAVKNSSTGSGDITSVAKDLFALC